MYKIISVFGIFLISVSCRESIKIEELENENLTENQNPTEKKDSAVNQIVYDFQKYLQFETSQSQNANFDKKLSAEDIDLGTLKTFSKEFLNKYFAKRKMNVDFPFEFESDYPESFYYYQGRMYENFYLLTFLHTDEICCKIIYAATFSTVKDSLIDISPLAYYGADGGWGGEQKAYWLNDFKVSTIEGSQYDDSGFRTEKSVIDSTWNEITLSQNGMFTLKELKSESYVGKIKTTESK